MLCHFVETFGLFFIHKVLLFVYEVSQEVGPGTYIKVLSCT